jgi:hypothetical protein
MQIPDILALGAQENNLAAQLHVVEEKGVGAENDQDVL